MMKSKSTPVIVRAAVISALLAISVAMPTTSFAESALAKDDVSVMSDKKHHKSQGKDMQKLVKYLELTDTQKAQMKSIKEQAKSENESIKLSIKQYHEQVSVLKDSAVFNEAEFASIYQSYQDVFAKAELEKAKALHAMYQILTPEQQQKWQEFQEKKRNKGKGKNRQEKTTD